MMRTATSIRDCRRVASDDELAYRSQARGLDALYHAEEDALTGKATLQDIATLVKVGPRDSAQETV